MAGTRTDIAFSTLNLETTYQGAVVATTYVPLLVENPNMAGLDKEMLADTSIRTSIFDQGDAPKSGLRTGTIKLVMDACGLGTAAASTIGINGTTEILRAAIGTRISGAKGTKITGAGASVTMVIVSGGTGFTTCLAVCVNNEATFVKHVSGKRIFVHPPFSAAPAVSGTVVYVGDTYYPGDTERRTFRFECHEEAQKLGYRALGCHLLPAFSNLGAGQQKAKLTFDVTPGDWTPIASIISSAIAPNCWNIPGVVQDDGRIYLSDGTNHIVAGCGTFDIANLLTGANNKDIANPNCMGTPKLIKTKGEISLVIYQPDNSDDPITLLRTWVTNRTTLNCFYQCGKVAGDMMAFQFPACFVSAYPKEVNVEGLTGISFKLGITLNRTATGGTKAAWRFARL